jgi:hypothetical protein
MTRALGNGYHVEIDAVDPRVWCNEIAAFTDANLYQLWQYGSAAQRFTSVSRLLLKSGIETIAAAEVRLVRLPFVKGGIAYVLWGPLCRWNTDVDVFSQVLRAMRNEYVVRRGMVLRISPRLFDQNDEAVLALSEEGFSPVDHVRAKRSLILDLDRSLEELRRTLDKKWRNCLSKAERSSLTLRSGTSLELFDRFVPVYEQMLDRKQLAPSADIQKHRRIQETLPDSLKMRVVLASLEGQACAGAIYSALGDTAVYLFGGTNAVGMRTCASYLVHWEILKALKERGIQHYDLNGIDPELNPGVYHFKAGLAGRAGKQVTFIGQFQTRSISPSIVNSSLLLAEGLRQRVRLSRHRNGGQMSHRNDQSAFAEDASLTR